MWFESVPRLGAYMAVPIVYESCLTDEALTQAISNFLEVTKLRDQQQDEQIQFQLDQDALQEQHHGEEPFVRAEKEWPEIKFEPFITQKKHYVLCIDTMGQDREFSTEEKQVVLETCQKFKRCWEERERQLLIKDRDARIELMNSKEHENELNQLVQQELAKLTEEPVEFQLTERPDECKDPIMEEESRQLKMAQLTSHTTAGLFQRDQVLHEAIAEVEAYTVIRHPRLV